MTPELKPCPFCGGKSILKNRWLNGCVNRKNYWVVCGKCQARIQDRNSVKRAIDAWNTRTPDIVYCKECKYLGIKDLCYGYCKKNMCGIVNPWDYCSQGKRMEATQ
jgi:Lar family restriction alleviation protein